MRRLVCIFLMLLLPLHSFAMQGGLHAEGNAFDIAHEIEHLVGVSHHHDDDHGDVHYDDSSASAEHFAEHASAHACAALPPAVPVLPPLAMSAVQTAETPYYIPDPDPRRLQRPPSSLG